MSVELHELQAFLALAEARNYRVAAAAVFVSQPALSRKIKTLEDKLGGPLFSRSRSGVELLPAGQTLLEGARRVLPQLEAVLVATQQRSRGQAGVLRIGFGTATISAVLHRVVADFRRRSPGVELNMRDMSSNAQRDALISGELDVGFIRLPIREPRLTSLRVTTDAVSLVLPRLPEFEHVTSLKDLSSMPFVLMSPERSRTFHEHSLSLCRAAGFQPRVVQLASEFFTMINLASVGLGAALVSRSSRTRSVPGVRWLELPKSSWDIGLVWRKDDRNPLVKRFVEAVRAVR